MARLPKCRHCGNEVDKNNQQFFKNSIGYYHEECYNIVETEKQHRLDLNDYVAELYKIEFPTGWMLKQIKEYRNKRQYTYKGMEYTLRYMYEVEMISRLEASDSGLGMIPYYYEKAKKYYSQLSDVSNSALNIDLSNDVEIIYLQPNKNTRKKKQIDMSSIV